MMLVTRPNYDQGTNYLYYWSKPVIDVATIKGVGVTDLSGKKANKKNFTSYYKKLKHKLVFFNGHGYDNLVTGYDDEILIDDQKNEFSLPGSIVVARSCRCGKVLADYLVNNGSLAFIGYKDDYVIKTSRKYLTKPLLDPMAALFLESSNMIVISPLKGKTTEESNRKSRLMLAKNLSRVSSGNSKDKDDTVRWLYHDFKNQIILGNMGAKL